MLTKSRPNTAIVRMSKTIKVRQKHFTKISSLNNDPITIANESIDPVTATVATSKDPASAATATDSNTTKTATTLGSTSEKSEHNELLFINHFAEYNII